MVVRLTDGRDAVRAYVAAQVALGRDHVLTLLRDDRDAVLALIGDLSEDESHVQPAPGEWSIFEVMQHVDATFPRSRERIATLSSGRPFQNPAVVPGQAPPPSQPAPPFAELRDTFTSGTNAVIDIVEQADPSAGLDLTAEHAMFGPFNWLEWAVYSHHVHTHDHIGQIAAVREGLRA